MQGGRRGRISAPAKRVEHPMRVLRRIIQYMGEYRWRLLLVAALVVVSALAQVTGTAYLQKMIDGYLMPLAQTGYDTTLLGGFLTALGGMLLIYMIGAFASFCYMRLMLSVSTGTLYKLRVDLFTHMEKLPLKYFDQNAHGDIMSRYTNDVDTIREMLSNTFANFISAAITVVSVFSMMLFFSWQLTILVVFAMFGMVKIVGMLGQKSGAYFVKQQSSIGAVNGYIEEMIEGQKVVKVFCHEQAVKSRFDALNEELRQNATNANTIANILMPIMGNLSHVLYALTAIAGGVLAINHVLTLGTVIAFLQYTRSFSQPITQISQQFNNVLNALAGADRIFKLLDEAPETDEGYVTLVPCTIDASGAITESTARTGEWAWRHPHSKDGSVTYQKVEGAVVLDDVSFGYAPDKTVLEDVSFYAKPGQKIALVGSTGAGKTTITNLINRFYDVPEGKIRYDGININKIRKPDLRRSMAMVLQDTHLFTGTVMENIRYGKLDATDADVENAAKLANAHGFIERLPEGYQTVLTADGANLSQGQRQLLAIARAAVADPPVLILDEATSSIDTRTEALVEKGMDRLMEGRTVFVIAHRLSTVRNANAIMVLENGRIIERGDHADLLKQQGKYYQLYTGMFELN